jgi:hypothetical protein
MSLFRANSVDFLVGGHVDWPSVVVTLFDCVFDSTNLNSTICSFVTIGCTVNPNATVSWTVGLFQCSLMPTLLRSRTPGKTPTVTIRTNPAVIKTPSPSRSGSLSTGTIVGIAIGAVAAVFGGGLVIFALIHCASPRHRQEQPLIPVTSSDPEPVSVV